MVGKDVLMTKKTLFFGQKGPHFWTPFGGLFDLFLDLVAF